MLKLFNSYGKKPEVFRPAPDRTVRIFTCGPSVYQRAHIGNFRTFLFEDILVRYLEYSGYRVHRGMSITDIEDKAIEEAKRRKTTVPSLTARNINEFIREMHRLRMKVPDYLPLASEHVEDAVQIILHLLSRGIAYWHRGNVYFDPLRFPGFGRLYGLDMTTWPERKRRFHKDTYPGMRWNRGDFILWHGYKPGDRNYWNSAIGRGRPAWNIQDPSMVYGHFNETLSCYCGGIDNLVRHHDYTRAVLESIRPYPVSKFWLHCHHLHIHGRKMSKSSGNIFYTDNLQKKGYSYREIRFLLIYGHYREKLDFSESAMHSTVRTLREFRRLAKKIWTKAAGGPVVRSVQADGLTAVFRKEMDADLNVRAAFDALTAAVGRINVDAISRPAASAAIEALKRIDEVLHVIF